jgi:phosphoglycolate phosphatase-like HAD superfamily hydrolase
LLRAIREFDMPAERCFMVGDRDVDAMAGASAGCSSVLVGAGGTDRPWQRFATFAEVAAWILNRPPMNAD